MVTEGVGGGRSGHRGGARWGKWSQGWEVGEVVTGGGRWGKWS